MKTKTATIVVDLGFGDAGKGSIVDALAYSQNVDAIARYTGGPHAAHHVVRADGVSHAFCQFGATFKAGVHSHLARSVIVKPENLMYEGHALEEKGMTDPFARLSIDPACRLVTSYHAMLCQMKEVSRGDQRRGTVGIGAGEAVTESEENPDVALRVVDLYEPQNLRQKLCSHYENMQRQAQALLRDCAHSPVYGELHNLYNSFMKQVRLKNVLALYRQFANDLPITICADAEWMRQCAGLPGDVIFEGAHAALLDREHGYYPYVAKTDTTTNEALRILAESNFDGKAHTIGVVRALGYRHGPGPFVTEDARLCGLFEEQHNKQNEWQGNVRYGWFDLLAIRHGMQLNQRVDALALTMLDHLDRLEHFQVCTAYEYLGKDFQRLEETFEFNIEQDGRVKITRIKTAPTHRTDALSRLLFDCVPCSWLCFDDKTSRGDDFMRFLESPERLGAPVEIVSSGPMLSDKKERRTLE
jgi:adenylosuccinate synthase